MTRSRAGGPSPSVGVRPPRRALRVRELDLGRGLRAVVVPLPHLSRATVTLFVRTGPLFETEARSGIAHFLEHMLHRGTSRGLHDAHAQAVAFERLGANLDAATGTDHGLLGASCPPENLGATIALLGEVATSPALRDIDTERGIVREELLEGLDERARLIDPDVVLRRLVFGDHALGRPILGTLDTLERFTVPMLRRQHRFHYVRSNVVLAVAGRLPPTAQLEAALRAAFSGLRAGPRRRAPRFVVRQTSPRSTIVQTSSSQTSLRVGFVAPGRGEPDEPATELLLRVLDDGTGSRLYERLCDRHGLCYDTSASYEAFEGVGLLDLAAETAPGRTGRVLGELLSLVSEIAEHGIRAEELERALNRSYWQARSRSDSPEGVAEQVGLGALGASPLTPLEAHERLRAVSLAELQRAARRLLRPERMSVVLVGPVSEAQERRAAQLIERFAKRFAKLDRAPEVRRGPDRLSSRAK